MEAIRGEIEHAQARVGTDAGEILEGGGGQGDQGDCCGRGKYQLNINRDRVYQPCDRCSGLKHHHPIMSML